MKKILILLAAAAVAVCLAASCDRNEPAAPETSAGDLIKTNIVLKAKTAEAPESKTHIEATDDPGTGTSTYTSHWDATGESLGLLLFKGNLTSANVPVELPGEDSDGSILFHKSDVDVEAGTNNMFLFYPYSAYDSTGDGYLVANLKSSQRPILGSFDPACDVMGYSTSNVNVVEGKDVVIENITLQRPMAIVRVRLNCGVDDKAYGEKVSSFKMQLSAPVPLTGKFKVTTTGSVDIVTPATYVEATYDLAKTLIAIGDATCNSVYLVTLPVTIPSGTDITFTIETQNYHGEKAIVRTKTLESNMALQGGKVNVIDLKVRDKDFPEEARYAGGIGEEGDPYLIATPEHMVHMNEDLENGKIKYFKLIEDIDMDSITDWAPANGVAVNNKFDKGVNFDGNNHTISNLYVASSVAYPSLFGVLYGDVKNLTIESAVIEAGTNNAGVVAGYIGTTDVVGNCENVTVKDATVTGSGTSSKGRNVGGFTGVIGNNGTIKNCHVTGNTTVTQNIEYNGSSAGGFVGNIATAATLINCTAKANVKNTASYYTGGFAGQIGGAVNVTFTSCAFLGGTLEAGRNSVKNSPVGGFIGRITGNSGSTFTNCYSDGAVITATKSGRVGGFVGDTGSGASLPSFISCYVKNATISGAQHSGGFGGVFYCSASKCYVENTTLTANDVNTGGFVGYPEGATLTDCYTTANVNGGSKNSVGGFAGINKKNNTFTCCYETGTVSGTGTGVGAFIGLVDVAAKSITKCIAWNGTLNFYGAVTSGVDVSTITDNYCGNSETVSAQATALGWDTTVWDLSGERPVLK